MPINHTTWDPIFGSIDLNKLREDFEALENLPSPIAQNSINIDFTSEDFENFSNLLSRRRREN